jgi:Flp pilus assembly protein TadG
VAAPFLALMFAIMETALVFFAGQTLETAVADSARMILTGQAQALGWDQVAFKTDVCKRAPLFDCAGIQVDVKAYSSDFSSVNVGSPVDANGNLQVSTFGYQAGTACSIMVVRLMAGLRCAAWVQPREPLGQQAVADGDRGIPQ